MKAKLFGKKKDRMRSGAFLLAMVLLIQFVIAVIPSPVGSIRAQAAEGPGVYAQSYLVFDLDKGKIVCDRYPNSYMNVASESFVMTALLTLEREKNLDAELTVSKKAADAGSLGFSLNPPAAQGEKMKVRDALYGMLFCSSRECEVALQEYIGGDTASFAEMMNLKAVQIGCDLSDFIEGEYTAHDLTRVFLNAMQYPVFNQICATPSYTIGATNVFGARVLTSPHKMINGAYAYPGAVLGMKNAADDGSRTVITYFEKDGHKLLCTLVQTTENKSFKDTDVLLEYGSYRVTGKLTERYYEPMDDICVSAQYINIYEKDNYYSKCVKTIAPGEKIERTGKWWHWARVLVNGQECYMEDKWLTKVADGNGAKPTAEPTATETPTPEPTATETPTPEPTATETPTPEPTATETPTPEPTATETPTPEPTETETTLPESETEESTAPSEQVTETQTEENTEESVTEITTGEKTSESQTEETTVKNETSESVQPSSQKSPQETKKPDEPKKKSISDYLTVDNIKNVVLVVIVIIFAVMAAVVFLYIWSKGKNL